MDLEQALQLIDRVLANVQGSRQDHVAITNAFQVIVENARGNHTPAQPGEIESNGHGKVTELADK